jgi:hypothetical protein
MGRCNGAALMQRGEGMLRFREMRRFSAHGREADYDME